MFDSRQPLSRRGPLGDGHVLDAGIVGGLPGDEPPADQLGTGDGRPEDQQRVGGNPRPEQRTDDRLLVEGQTPGGRVAPGEGRLELGEAAGNTERNPSGPGRARR